ncbi:DNA-packaging protein [Photorhabdus noenieputensis]|uniref:phage tail protein n=1 Tax=Photorhabdus noenieputensis TaxID=1208607 RepID=UPI001BD543A5|nr:phage tail protein [Photorhabdus noenieputensis]MBS9437030.1 DNA-packaging protein [Photorhabdus noenieputensis]MCK3670408.1 tail fiber protein [Photorhabdus noenieputensis]
MSQKNDFKAFSIVNNSNVVSQEKYEESQSLKTGFPPDDISTHVLNKALRQSSTIASVVANFIAKQSDDDVLDNGDIDKLTSQLNQALKKIAADGKVPNSRKINGKALTEDINLNASDVGAYTRAEVDRLIKTASEIPVGSPIPWPLSHPPIGYLTCNGSAFNKLQYPKLAEAYPDGRLPDLRGEFIRGWDDSKGIDPSRSLLSWQEGSYLVQDVGNGDALVAFSHNDRTKLQWDTPQDNNISARTRYTGGNHTALWMVNKDYVGISRPRNIAFNYIMRAE